MKQLSHKTTFLPSFLDDNKNKWETNEGEISIQKK